MTRCLACIRDSISEQRLVGATIFSPFKIIPRRYESSLWWFQNSDKLMWYFLFLSGQPLYMTPFSVWNCGFISVWALISSNFESLTGRLLDTLCTWISMPSLSLISWSDSDFLDNVFETGMSLPGQCTMVKLYFWSWRIILCSLGGTDARGFRIIYSWGLWSLSTATWQS